MFGFMFAVLGSIVFWVCYFILSLFFGTFFLKKIAPLSYETFKTGVRPMSNEWKRLKADAFGIFLMTLLCYVFWIFILIYFFFEGIIVYIIIPAGIIIGKSFRHIFLFVDGALSKVDIKISHE